MVSDSILFVIVGTDLFRPTASTDLTSASLGKRGLLLVLFGLQEPRTKHDHCLGPVLYLALLVLHGNHDAGGLVCDAHRRVGGVDALPAGATRAVYVDLQIV